jgi:hypothetical protein
MFTIDLRENAKKKEIKEFSIIKNICETLAYTLIDMVIMAILIWMFGSSIVT